MFLLRWVIRPYLYIQYFSQKWIKNGAFGKDQAVYLQNAYRRTGNCVKDGLFRHHVKQFHESSCSVATMASVINTLLEKKGRALKPAVTQLDLLETVRSANWQERMGDKGYNGRRGLPLKTLGTVVKGSLSAYRISYRFLDVVQAQKDSQVSRRIRQTLRSRLQQFERQGNCVIIAHFDQGSFIQDLHIPHISPVGGFDPVSDKVTVLDVDAVQARPYQVSFDTFYKGLSFDYNPVFHRFGYREGGYVFIQL